MSWGKVKVDGLKDLKKALEKLEKLDVDKLCRECSRELAGRLLALVIPATPVGQYPASSGKKGGTLRRGWTARTEEEAAGGKTDRAAFVHSLPIKRQGNDYIITIINPVKYASYVEFGHRTVSGGWVDGQYMLTISEEKLQQIAPKVLERMVYQKLKEAVEHG